MSPQEHLAIIRKKRTHPTTGDGYTVHLVMRSTNEVTGPMPVASTDAASCPTSCPMRNRGCYGENMPVALQWARVADRGVRFLEFVEQVRTRLAGREWRYGEVGDLPGIGEHLDRDMLRAMVEANREVGAKGYGYTHKHRTSEQHEAIREANASGFTINLSADSLDEADRLAELQVGPVVVRVPEDAPDKFTTPAGRAVVVCPNETQGMTCADCRICSKQREVIVAFRNHGPAKRIVASLDNLRRSKEAAT